MALNNARIADLAFAHLVGAESLRMAAYSGFTLLVLNNTAWAVPGRSVDHKVLRKHLKVRAMETGVIALNTWESYAKGIDDAAAKFAAHLADDADFLAIRDMAEDDAIEAVRILFEGVNVTSGGDVRLWSKAPDFAPLDKDAAKREAKARAADKAANAAKSGAAAFFAQSGTDSAAISDMAPAAPVSPLAAILAAIGTLGEADALAAMDALNAHMAALQAIVAAAPAPTTAPVLADDVAPDAASTLAAHFNRKVG